MSNKHLKNALYVVLQKGSRTLPIMDEFDKYDFDNKKYIYDCMILLDHVSIMTRSFNRIYIDLIVTRQKLSDMQYAGSITISKLVKYGLYIFVLKQLNTDIVREYIDSYNPYSFEIPYCLKAQTSTIIRNYGTKWEWHGHEGEIVEQTLYGETNQYTIGEILIHSKPCWERKEYKGWSND